MIRQLIIGKEAPTDRQLFLWNMIGSAVYALASLILTYLTIRIVGENDGGIFAISLTLAQMFIYIAYYEMRNFQVTDAEDKYTFKDYHAAKILNCFLMMLVVTIYCLFKNYDLYKFLVVFLVCIYRMLDGYADVYEAEFHNKGRLDMAGKSMTFRTLISVGIYFVILILTHNVLWAVAGAIVSGIIGIFIFNLIVFECVGKIQVNFQSNTILSILKDCFPLFLGMFLWTYLLSASRIAVDDVMTSEYQSYYQVLFLPVSVINLFAGFLIRPSLLGLTQLHSERKNREFWLRILKMVGLLMLFTIVCMAGAYVFGIPVLNIIVGCELSEYRSLFVFLIFAGGFNALAYLLYYVLTIYRSGKSILAGYIISSVVAFVISPILVRRANLWGAAWSYMISIGVLLLLFVVFIIIVDKSKNRERDLEKII